MINILNINTIDGTKKNLQIASAQDHTIHAENLTLLPALTDPHVHFRIPGMDYKEDWRTAARASIAGGVTTVFDMPNTLPPTTTVALLQEKKKIIDAQLKEAGIPLHYQLFFGADKDHLAELSKIKHDAVGIKIFMGCSTGNLVVDSDETLSAIFEIAAAHDILVAVHAEDEHILNANKAKYQGEKDYAVHSKIRDTHAAVAAVEKAISLTRRFGTRLYILHMSTAEEVALIQQAKQQNLPVYAETTPHHLFLNTHSYATLAGKAVMNPPLRSEKDQTALFAAIRDNIIDTIGSDHAPHTLSEKEKPYGQCPSGVPGIETLLPLLLNAHQQGLLSLQNIVSLTSTRAREIFRLPANNDWVLVDLNKKMRVDEKKLKTKCAWSPYAGMELTGWPRYVVLGDKLFDLEKL